MMTEPRPPARLAFGPFEVDASGGELRKSGVRLHLPRQPFQILLILLSRAGEIVTREELREQIWTQGTFVDFEHGLSAAMNKLRRALSDSAEHPHYIETIPGRGYRFIGSLEHPHPGPVVLINEPATQKKPLVRKVWRWWWLAIAACAGSFFLGWELHRTPTVSLTWKLTRLTADPALSNTPALSPDGKLLAYSSDRNSPGERDLHIKQVAGGQPIRLTFDGRNNTTPNFSPDGSKIVFRSSRDGGGIYKIPAFGGEVHLIARYGLNPKFSPDGSQVAYWIGAPNVASAVPGSRAVWVISAAGGQPRRVGPNFTAARRPIWSPDGKHILCIASTSAKAYDSSSVDWWLAPADGGPAAKTGAYDALARVGLIGSSSMGDWPFGHLQVPGPDCWLTRDNSVIFSQHSGERSNLWKIGVSLATSKVYGQAKRLTAGAGNEVELSCASGDLLAFTNIEIRKDIWALRLDLNRGTPDSSLERITQSPAEREHASLSLDGTYVAFASTQSGPYSLWMRELASGKEIPVTNSSFVQRFPVMSPSASRIAFSSFENGKRVIYVSAVGGVPEKLCEGCFRATDWSRDEKQVLIFSGDPYQIRFLDVTSHRQTTVFKHPAHNLLYAHFSPDNGG